LTEGSRHLLTSGFSLAHYLKEQKMIEFLFKYYIKYFSGKLLAPCHAKINWKACQTGQKFSIGKVTFPFFLAREGKDAYLSISHPIC